MKRYYISTVHTCRVSTLNDVENFHEELKTDSRFELKKFEYQQKDIKEKGEIVESYYLVKATLVFNNEKEPMVLVGIDYDLDSYIGPDLSGLNDYDEEEE